MAPGVSRDDIRRAAERIEGCVRRTPVADLGDVFDSGCRLTLKLDSMQQGAILEAQRWLWDTCRVLAEPGACTPIAALLTRSHAPKPGERVVAVISGANTAALETQV